jgi:hypothetical protein
MGFKMNKVAVSKEEEEGFMKIQEEEEGFFRTANEEEEDQSKNGSHRF